MPQRSWASMKCSSNTRTRVSRVLGWSVYWRSSMIGQRDFTRACSTRPGRNGIASSARTLGPLGARAAGIIRTANEPHSSMATPKASTSLLIRLDPRNRGGLQRQIYASIRRAILDGVVRPGTRLPSSRALADDLGVSRTTTLLAVEQLQAEGYLTGRRGSGTFVAAELPDDLIRRRGLAGPTGMKHPTLSRRGAALVAAPQGAHRLDGPAARLPHRHARRRSVPGRALVAAREPAAASDHPGAARLRRAGRPARAARGHRRSRPGRRAAHAASAEQILIVAGAQHGLELICRVLLDPGDRVWMEEPGYPGRAQRAARRGRAHPAGAGGRRGPGRRGGRAARGRCAPGVRDAVASVSAGRAR